MTTDTPTREEWLQRRRDGIGSSDAAAVAGLSKWNSPLGVYLEKTGQLPPQEESPEMRWGTLLEPAIALAYEQETGRKLHAPGLKIYQHPQYAWMLATPDRIAEDRLVELKTANPRVAHEWGEPGTDEVPPYYIAQVQHQLAVTGHDQADVAVLIGGSDFRIYHIERSEPFIERLIEIEAAFWQRVLDRDPPEIDWQHPGTVGLMDFLHPPTGGAVDFTAADDCSLVDDYLAAAREEKAATKRKEEAKARLIHRMGDATLATTPDGCRVRRKVVERAGYTAKPTTYISFSVSQPKEKNHGDRNQSATA